MRHVVVAVVAALVAAPCLVAAPAAAGPGVGVCVYGLGVAQPISTGPNVFVGVYVGSSPPAWVYLDGREFGRRCCADAGEPPNCMGTEEAAELYLGPG